MLIRETTAVDHGLIARMRIAFLAERDSWPAEPSLEDLTADIHELLTTVATWSWVAESASGDCVGIATVIVGAVAPRAGERRMREGHLVNVYVVPEHRGAGVGRKVMEAVVAACTERGLRQLVLHATEDGRPLYASLGFEDPGSWMELRLTSG